MKNTAALLLSAILIAAAAVNVRARTDDGDGAVDGSPRNRGYGFLMLEEPVSPRNAAMGSAGTALGGYGFRYYNPAQPFFSSASYAAAEFGRMPGGVNKGGFETAAFFSDLFSAASFFSSAVDFRTSDEQGLGAAASSGTTVGAMSVGYVSGKVAVGVSFSMAEDRIWVSSDYAAVALSAGIGYKLLDDRLSLGAAWMNAAAWSRGFAGDGSRWRDGRVPVFARAGAAWSDTLLSLPYTAAADAVYRDEDGTVSVPVGFEAKVLPSISLRIGKRIGWENEVMSLGIGINIDRLSFDAAFTPTVFVDDYEMKWSMGFSYTMGGRKKAEAVKKEIAPVKEPVAAEEPVPIEEEPEPTEEALTEEKPVSTEEAASTDKSAADEEEEPAEEPSAVTPQPSPR